MQLASGDERRLHGGRFFRISVISEPPIALDTPSELRPKDLKHPARFISFIFFVLEAC
jgi:hypothetical protein